MRKASPKSGSTGGTKMLFLGVHFWWGGGSPGLLRMSTPILLGVSKVSRSGGRGQKCRKFPPKAGSPWAKFPFVGLHLWWGGSTTLTLYTPTSLSINFLILEFGSIQFPLHVRLVVKVIAEKSSRSRVLCWWCLFCIVWVSKADARVWRLLRSCAYLGLCTFPQLGGWQEIEEKLLLPFPRLWYRLLSENAGVFPVFECLGKDMGPASNYGSVHASDFSA